jgi:spore coat protein U-like protein
MNKKIAMFAATAAAMVVATSANAAEANLAVSADVQATCSVSAATLAFGTYDTISGAAVDQATPIEFTCSNGTTYSVSLGNGLHYDSTALTRRMNHSGAGLAADDYLTYKLYEGTGTTTPWDGMSGSSTGASQSVNVTGQIDAGQTTSKAGTYADTVVITVTAS